MIFIDCLSDCDIVFYHLIQSNCAIGIEVHIYTMEIQKKCNHFVIINLLLEKLPVS